MIIENLNQCYEVIRQISSADRMSEFLCLEQQSQEEFLLVRIADPTLAKRFTLFLEEKISGTDFPDYKECFQADGAFYVAFTYSSERTLANKLSMENCTIEERAEIARRLLEQLLLRSPHPYFMKNSLRPDMVTVTESLDVAWNYHLDEVRTFDCCTMGMVCQRLAEVMHFLFEKELHGKQYPSLENYLLELKEDKLSDYLNLYREFMPVYEVLCVNVQERLSQTYLERLWEGCRKIIDKPKSLKGYLHLGKRYVAKKMAFIFVLAAVLLPLSILWIAYPWVQSRFLTKTMVFNSEDTEGYTGKVRLVDGLEADNVIFVGALADGRINGYGTLYDPEGNLRYQGEFLEDQYSGMGELYYRSGNVEYVGQLVASQYEGKGKLYDEEGVLIYEGDFSQGLYEGSGTLYYADGGVRYCGGFSRGLYEGMGVLFHENGVASYEGEFLQGKRSGNGKVYEENGELIYDGFFSQNRYEGEGTLYRDGQIVSQGSFHTGVLTSGTAVYYDRKGNLLFQGNIDNGLYAGQGKLYSEGILIYEGGFAEGKYHGSGKEYADETGMLLYDGMFDRGEYCGEGRLYDEDTGTLLYEGCFYRSLYDGEGKLYDPVCGYLIYEGGFREGQYDGQGKSYVSGILVYEGEFLLDAYNGKGILYDETTGAVVFEGMFYDNEPRPVPEDSEQEDETSEIVEAVNPAE